MARRDPEFELLRDQHKHRANHGQRECEDQFLRKRYPAGRNDDHDRAEGDPAPEDARIWRPSLGSFGFDQHRPDHRQSWDEQSQQEHRRAIEQACEPAGQPGHRKDAKGEREAAENLHHAELRPYVVLGPRIAGFVNTGDDLGRHGVRDDVLDHDTDHDQQRAEKIELLGGRNHEMPAGCGRKDKHAGGRERGADQHIGAALRAEDGHAVHQLAEHHLHGPWQAEPHADRRELGWAQSQLLLDPHVARDVDQPKRPVGKVDRDHRQIAEAKAQNWPQDRGEP